MNSSRKLLLSASLLQLAYSALLLYALLTPLYRLTGVVEGEASIGWYSLFFYTTRIHIPALDTLHILVFPVYIHAIYTLMTSTAGIILYMGGLEKYTKPIEESLYANALVATSFTGLLVQVSRITRREVSQLATDYTRTTSAGTIILGRASLHTNHILEKIVTPEILLTTAILLLATGTLYIISTQHGRG